MELKGNQEAFDAMVAHMRAQKYVRSYATDSRGGETCKYRGPNGLKCAVGALIQDEHYSWELEGSLADSLNVKTSLRRSGWEVESGLLEAMQDAHDNYAIEGGGVEFEAAAREAANEYDLSYTPPA